LEPITQNIQNDKADYNQSLKSDKNHALTDAVLSRNVALFKSWPIIIMNTFISQCRQKYTQTYNKEQEIAVQTSAHQEMRDSEREPFYDDIAHVIQNTKKEFHLCDSNPRSLRYTYKACGRVLT